MSSDGEVEVSVRAEGVDEAAGEIGGDAGGIPGGGGRDGDGGAGGRGSGKFGKLLTRIAGLLAFLGPILNVLGVVSNVVEAFVAPLAILLLRLLQPALVKLLSVLPVWFDIVEFIGDVAERVGPLAGILGVAGFLLSVLQNADGKLGGIKTDISDLLDDIRSLPGDIVNSLENGTLDTDIGNAVVGALPDSIVPEGAGGDVETTDNQEAAIRGAEVGTDVAGALGVLPGGPAVNIALEGGLDALVERIDRDPNKDIQ